jgi:hypothetical protein
MKTKAFLLICLLIGVATFQLSAQNGKNGTGTVSGSLVWEGYWPIYCNGTQIDNLFGTITYHYEKHFKDGNLTWAHAAGFGEAVSTWIGTPETAEVFKVQEIDNKYMPGLVYATIHWNIKGNKGSHYIGTALIDNNTGELTVVRAVCPGNDN